MIYPSGFGSNFTTLKIELRSLPLAVEISFHRGHFCRNFAMILIELWV